MTRFLIRIYQNRNFRKSRNFSMRTNLTLDEVWEMLQSAIKNGNALVNHAGKKETSHIVPQNTSGHTHGIEKKP